LACAAFSWCRQRRCVFAAAAFSRHYRWLPQVATLASQPGQ
jgi:hypothetical protein